MRTVLVLVAIALLLSCAVPILVGWQNPASRFLVGFVQTRDVKSRDPKRTAASACWLILGFTAGAVGLLLLDNPAAYVCAGVFVACLVVAAWVRFGEAPQSLRPAAMRETSGQ